MGAKMNYEGKRVCQVPREKSSIKKIMPPPRKRAVTAYEAPSGSAIFGAMANDVPAKSKAISCSPEVGVPSITKTLPKDASTLKIRPEKLAMSVDTPGGGLMRRIINRADFLVFQSSNIEKACLVETFTFLSSLSCDSPVRHSSVFLHKLHLEFPSLFPFRDAILCCFPETPVLPSKTMVCPAGRNRPQARFIGEPR